MKLDGRRILITGGGSGIGLELARRLAGANHVVIAGRDTPKLERARAEIPRLRTLRLDVTSETAARGAIAWLGGELGGLDLLVNNAGLLRGYPLAGPDAETKAVEDVEVNLIGSIRLTSLALPLLTESPEGALLFMSSAVALAAVPGYSVYAATKAAVHSLARSLRAELAASGIRVFEVLPPIVDTGPVSGLDVPKVSPSTVADVIVDGLRRDREEIRVGPVRQLAPLARLMPKLADRIVTRAFAANP
jgi:short-subunit dehydrogenase involved in D-alanine esterification of teichoic acids